MLVAFFYQFTEDFSVNFELVSKMILICAHLAKVFEFPMFMYIFKMVLKSLCMPIRYKYLVSKEISLKEKENASNSLDTFIWIYIFPSSRLYKITRKIDDAPNTFSSEILHTHTCTDTKCLYEEMHLFI